VEFLFPPAMQLYPRQASPLSELKIGEGGSHHKLGEGEENGFTSFITNFAKGCGALGEVGNHAILKGEGDTEGLATNRPNV
jgi:hypothetical protein